jgi:hypothetical protein
MVRSKDVNKVQLVSRMTGDLVRAGVVLGAPGGSQGPQFLYTQLSTIKPSMITDATKNARAAADQFASDSGAKVGAIRRASQGLFSISDRDQAASGDTEGGGHYYPRASEQGDPHLDAERGAMASGEHHQPGQLRDHPVEDQPDGGHVAADP